MGTDDFGKRMNAIPKYVVSSTVTDAETQWGETSAAARFTLTGSQAVGDGILLLTYQAGEH
jgi:hypothetical protein